MLNSTDLMLFKKTYKIARHFFKKIHFSRIINVNSKIEYIFVVYFLLLVHQFYNMMHRGEIVQKIIKDLGINLSVLSNSVGVSRATLYRYFDTPDLSWKIIYDIGMAIRYDFKKDFPEMPLEFIEKIIPLLRE